MALRGHRTGGLRAEGRHQGSGCLERVAGTCVSRSVHEMPETLLGLHTSVPDLFPLGLVPSLIKLLPNYKGAHIILNLNT